MPTTDIKLKKRAKIQLPCVSLIGMPGSGKSTIGEELGRKLGWSFLDTDKLLESLYACRLQELTDIFGKEKFLEIESGIIAALEASRCVIATGGSVVYSSAAIAKLKSLGPLVYLDLPFEEIERRINENPERGIAIAPGQSLRDLHRERAVLYKEAASFSVYNHEKSIEEAAGEIAHRIRENLPR